MRVLVFSASCILLAFPLASCAARSQLDLDAAPTPSIPCGDTSCRTDQWCVHPCLGDGCHLHIEAGSECPAGYHQDNPLTPNCCSPPTPPPSCVDDPKKLSPYPKECGEGELNFGDFDASDHQLSCWCTV
jgi:hypothetical protein